jgi:hypothetical protein
VPLTIEYYYPYQAMYVSKDGDKRSGTGQYWINKDQGRLAIAFAEDLRSQVSKLERATNHHGRIPVGGGSMFLYGKALLKTAFPSQGGADTVQSPTVGVSNQGNETRAGGEGD